MFDEIMTMLDLTLKPRLGRRFISLKVSFHRIKKGLRRSIEAFFQTVSTLA
jgi:hypothetical protein